MDFSGILNDVVDLGNLIYDSLVDIYYYFNRPIVVSLEEYVFLDFKNPILNALAESILPFLELLIGDYSLLDFMFGAGLLLYISWQLVSWILNIVT